MFDIAPGATYTNPEVYPMRCMSATGWVRTFENESDRLKATLHGLE